MAETIDPTIKKNLEEISNKLLILLSLSSKLEDIESNSAKGKDIQLLFERIASLESKIAKPGDTGPILDKLNYILIASQNMELVLGKMAEKDFQINQLEAQITSLKSDLDTIKTERDGLLKVRPMIKFDDLAGHLRGSLQTLNIDAKKKSEAGEAGYIVDNFEVEIRGGIDVTTSDICLTQLTPQEITPQSVSSIRFSIRPIPVIKIVDDP